MATGIDHGPLVPKEPMLRRCRVPDMWGRISLDWNNNPPLPKGRLQNSPVNDSKMVLKPCSVRVERCNVSASSLVWGVEKVRLEDSTVQLLYHGVRVRDGDSDGAMETSEDGGCEKTDDEMQVVRSKKKFSMNNNCLKKNKQKDKKVMDDGFAVKSEKDDYDDKIELSETDFKCPKCGKHVKVVPANMLRFHMLTHYYQVFFDVLPDKKPFNCPLCEQSSRDRVSLARHYAFSHEKIFELTDLTPEALLYSERRMKELEQKKNKSDEKRIQVLLASPLTKISHNVPNSESVETFALESFGSEGEEKIEDSYPTTTLQSVSGITPFPLVKQEQEKNLAAEYTDDGDDEFDDLLASVWSNIW